MSSRRRRKSQSSKERRRSPLKWVALSGLTIAILLVVGAVFGLNAVRSYLRSDDFRMMLGTRAGGVLEGSAEFEPFSWDGWNVSTTGFSFEGDDALQQIKATGIDASVDIGAVWSGIYRIEDIRLRDLEIIGDFTKKDEGVEPEVEVNPAAGDEQCDKEGFLQSLLPKRVEVTGIDVSSIHGRALTGDGEWRWSNTSAKVVPGASEGVFDLNLLGGRIETPLALIGDMNLKRAKGRLSGDHFYLLSSDFDLFRNAHVKADGDFGLESGRWQLAGDLEGARIEEIISEDWRQRLMGPLSLDFQMTGEPDRDARLQGSLKIKDGILTALPVLDRIAAYSNTIRFRRLVLSEAQLDFMKVGEMIELKNIRLASEGLIRLEGSMRLVGDVIEFGQFRVGIMPGTLAHLPGAETKVFRSDESGLLWTPLTISGTLDSPREDLSERLIAAAGERMFEVVPETGQWALKYSGEVLNESTKQILADQGINLGTGQEIIGRAGQILREGSETAIKEGSDLIEQGSEIIKDGTGIIEGGVGTLFDLFGRPIPKKD